MSVEVTFKRYASIENHYRQKQVDYFLAMDESIEWIALEKVNGCNFIVHMDASGTIRFGRRGAFLEDGEKFVGHDRVAKKYDGDYRTVFNRLAKSYPNAKEFVLYTELFGGRFVDLDGAEIKAPGSVVVQKGMSYHPDNHMVLYDIYVIDGGDSRATDHIAEGDEEGKIADGFFLNYDDVLEHSKDLEHFKSLPILHRGKLGDLLKLSPVFDTTIPSMYGLVSPKGSVAEGYILKTNKTSYTGNHRCILKFKNPAFAEVEEEVPTKTKKTVVPKPDVAANPEFEQIKRYVTKNRLAAVMSKMTDDEKSKPKFVYAKVADDALLDYAKDNGKDNIKSLKQYVGPIIKMLDVLAPKWESE